MLNVRHIYPHARTHAKHGSNEGERAKSKLWKREMNGKDNRGREATIVRNGEREWEMKTDGGWIERGQIGCRGVGSGTQQREGRMARGGGFEWFSCSGTVAEIGRSCPFFLTIACVVITRALLFRFVSFCLVPSRSLLFSPVPVATVDVWSGVRLFHWSRGSCGVRHRLSVFP